MKIPHIIDRTTEKKSFYKIVPLEKEILESGGTKQTYIISKQNADAERKAGYLKGFLAGLALSAAVSGTAVGVNSYMNEPSRVKTVMFDENIRDISDVADIYDTDENMIAEFNGIDREYVNSDKDLPIDICKLKVPAKYDYMKDAIEKKTAEMYSKDCDIEEVTSEIEAMNAKKAAQNEVANTYTDGKYVYISVKDSEESPVFDKKYLGYGIKAEDLKNLFDIEDHALARNNNIPYTWGRNEFGGYMDYTYSYISCGSVVKVPVKSIKTDDIDLTGYLK